MFAKTADGNAKCLADFGRVKAGAIVPRINELWADVQEWLDQGNEWQPMPVEPEPVPQSITARQARLALLSIGKLGDVDTAIAGMPSPQKEQAQIEWEYATAIERQHEFVGNLGAALGLTDSQVDDLFKAGSQL